MPSQNVVRALVVGSSAALVPLAQGTLVTSTDIFQSPQARALSFNERADGSTINLIPGATRALPAAEYAAQGISFSQDLRWVHDGNDAFQAALAAGGSATIAIPSSFVDSFDILFATPVAAFGLFVVNNRNVDANGPTFTAFDAQGNVIDTATFGGGAFLDGTFTSTNTQADYGFMGISTDGPGIARVSVVKQAAIFDDLRWLPVPTPGTLALGAVTLALAARRRR